MKEDIENQLVRCGFIRYRENIWYGDHKFVEVYQKDDLTYDARICEKP